MLYIMMRNPIYLEWHVHMPLPFPLNDHNVHEVVAIQADTDELA